MNNKATVKIKSRDIPGTPSIPGYGHAQHLFIIQTKSDGSQIILRGGPETPTIMGMFKDDLKIIIAPYSDEYKHLFPNDLVKNPPSVTIAEGTDAVIQNYVDKMWQRGQEINKGKYDYKLPTPGFSASACHVQNSNTAVKDMVAAAGLEGGY